MSSARLPICLDIARLGKGAVNRAASRTESLCPQECAHHRRFNYLEPQAQADGSRSNPDRYGYDFVPVDRDGEMSRGDPKENASWFGFGEKVTRHFP
jgi:hypothetical protein